MAPLRMLPALVCAVLFAQPAGAAEDLGSFVDRVLTAYGGAAALERAGAVRQSGQMTSAMRGTAGTVVRFFERPDKLRIEITFPGEPTEVRVLDGERGWKQGAEAPAPLHDAMVLQAARIALPLLLLERKSKLVDRGGGTGADGTATRVVELPLGPGLSLILDVGAETGRILRSRGIMTMGGSAMEFATEYGDFRDWDGLLVAAREDHYAMGHYIGHTRLDRVERLDSLAPETFRP